MAIKLIVTHKTPDLDAITSVWLLKRFDEQNFGEAQVAFVNPGDKISLEELSDYSYQSYDVVHVDTGGGEFDHHDEELLAKRVCAASLVLQHIHEIHPESKHDEALRQIVDHALDIDLYEDVYWPERNETRNFFRMSEILPRLKNIGLEDEQIIEYGFVSLDAVYSHLKSLALAKEELHEATIFETKWGQAIALETQNVSFVPFAQRNGYPVVVRKDIEYGHIQIKALPKKKIDLSEIYEKILKHDPRATWYFHPSKTMLINGSDKRRNQVGSSLSLAQVIDILKNT